MIIRRDFYLQKLIQKKDNGRVKIITGIRRCGKSYLLFHLYKSYLLKSGVSEEDIVSLSLDDVDFISYRNPFELHSFLKSKITSTSRKIYIFIDEIQFVSVEKNPYVNDGENPITFVDVLLGLMKYKNADIYVTGSNSRMLSSDVLTQFRDRGDEIHVLPLSFSEIYDLYDRPGAALNDYLIYGGMPYIFSLSSAEEKSLYLKNLFTETYMKDILERHQLQNDGEVLGTLLNFVSSSIGSLTNPYKLSRRFLSEKNLSISSATVSKYLSFFEEAFILYKAHRFDVKGSRYFSTPLKYYFSDLGLRNARLNFRQVEKNHAMENVLYNELLRRGYNVDVGVVEYDRKQGKVREKGQLEVDFIVNRSDKRYYIQSALHVDSEEKRNQEIASLLRIDDSFKKIVVVLHPTLPRYDDHGIFYVSLEDFLLQEDSLSFFLEK